MNKLSVVFYILVFLPLPLHSAVYKWVDADGNTQYSSTPPPATATSHATTLNVGSTRKTGASEAKVFGAWWGRVDGGLIEFVLSQRKFHFRRIQLLGKEKIAVYGVVKSNGSKLEFTYYENSIKPELRDQTVAYFITRLDNTRLQFTDEAGKRHDYYRIGDRFLDRKTSHQLLGKWQETGQVQRQIVFKKSGVSIHRQLYGHWTRVSNANWWIDNTSRELSIEYVKDFERSAVKYELKPQYGDGSLSRIGRVDTFTIKEIGDTWMTLLDAKGRQSSYKRLWD